jgi:hypothetical protein
MILSTALASSVVTEVPDPPDEDDEDEDPDDPVATGLVMVWLLPPHPDNATPSAAAPVTNAILAFMIVASERCTDR